LPGNEGHFVCTSLQIVTALVALGVARRESSELEDREECSGSKLCSRLLFLIPALASFH
jgi:hypothetical protein